MTAVEQLCERYMSLTNAGAFAKINDKAQPLIFSEMTEIALWGNATDLSTRSSLSLDQIWFLKLAKTVHEGESRIVSNNMS